MKTGITDFINYKLIELMGVPKKYKNNPYIYRGYISLINKWRKEGYGLKYIYYIILKLDDIVKNGKSVNIGLAVYLLKNSKIEFDINKDNIVIPTRKSLLRAGYTIEQLPKYMRTKKENTFLDKAKNSENNVSMVDVNSLAKFIRGNFG